MMEHEMRFTIILMILLQYFIVNCFGIIVQFDGGIQRTHTFVRHAACTACIILEPFDNKIGFDTVNLQPDHALVKIGGKSIKTDSTTTSAEMEYEGLVSGLQGLIEFMKEYENMNLVEATRSTIIVQGDCKTVISQMNGVSRPRKLESYHLKCQALLSDLSKYNVCFEHIPRQFNTLCDQLADRIILDQQEALFNSLLSDIKSFELESKESMLVLFPSVMNTLTDMIKNRSLKRHVCFSDRIEIYRWLLSISWSLHDHLCLLQLSEVFQNEIEVELSQEMTWPRQQVRSSIDNSLHDANPDRINDLIAEAVMYQIAALRMLGREKEANRRLKEAHRKLKIDTEDSSLFFPIVYRKLQESEHRHDIQFNKKVLSNIEIIADAVDMWFEINLNSTAIHNWTSGVWFPFIPCKI